MTFGLHVVGLPHTRFAPSFSWCAYTTKVARFARMMTDQGFAVTTYGNGPADLAGDYVPVTDVEWPDHFIPDFDAAGPVFAPFNAKATARIAERIDPGDVVCLIGGVAQEPIAAALSSVPAVEFGIGYEGVFAAHRVWESYAWQHYVLGKYHQQGSPLDAVIPNYFDPADFYVTPGEGDYFAFVGRVCTVKGVDIAVAAAQAAGVPLKIAGHVFGDAEWVRELQGDVEWVGELTPLERAAFLSKACAVLAPTRYVEPFGGICVEAMFSGVPVIVPDFGAFTEYVTDGLEGFRCRSVPDYVRAINDTQRGLLLRGDDLRKRAEDRFSMDAVGPLYTVYLADLGRV